MKADELTTEVKVLHERTSNLDKRLEKLTDDNESLRRQLEDAKVTIARAQQHLADHIAHVEKWDTRRWGIIGLFVGAIISLVANLVVALVRK